MLARTTVSLMYLSAVAPDSSPSSECVARLLVQCTGLGDARLFVLGHEGRATWSVRVRLGIRCAPGVECDPELGPKTMLGNTYRVFVAGDVGGEPRLEGRRIEVTERGRLAVGAARFHTQCRRLRQLDPRLRRPLRRRISRPSGEQRHDGEQHRLGDRDQPVATVVVARMMPPVPADFRAHVRDR